nr:MAG TPA: hypothetical protein [Caudoviricetes sp.]
MQRMRRHILDEILNVEKLTGEVDFFLRPFRFQSECFIDCVPADNPHTERPTLYQNEVLYTILNITHLHDMGLG